MLSEKQKKLMDLLLKQQGIMTVEKYAVLLGVSRRSVYTWLDILEPYMCQRGFCITKIPSKGIKVTQLEHTASVALESDDDYSLTSRRFELINRVIVRDEIVDLEDFCDEFFVSGSSVRKDVLALKKMLENYPNIEISISKGKISKEYRDELTMNHALINMTEAMATSFTAEEKKNYYDCVFDPRISDVVIEMVREYLDTLNLNIAEHYISHICTVLITLTIRAQSGHHIPTDSNLLDYDRIKQMADILLAKQFLETLTHRLGVEFSEGDVTLLSGYLNADRIQISNFKKIEKEDLVIYRRILRKIESIVDISLDEQNELVQNLLFHLNAMVYRLRRGISIQNGLIDNIKREFGVLFNLIWIVMESENSQLHIRITEDEVGFMLIHIQNIIEQQKRRKNILLVCPQGLVVSNLILNQIRAILPTYNFIETISIERINEVKLDSVDFVISTVDIPNLKKPLVKVSPIISKEDILNVTDFYQNMMFAHPDTHQYCMIQKFMDEDFVMESSLGTREEIIEMMCGRLLANEVVTAEYKESMLTRETLGSTDNIYSFAIPHGDIQYVNRTLLSVVLLKKPIRWNKHSVSIVIFFNVSRDDLVISKGILDDIYALMNSESFAMLLKKGITKKKFINFIKKETYD